MAARRAPVATILLMGPAERRWDRTCRRGCRRPGMDSSRGGLCSAARAAGERAELEVLELLTQRDRFEIAGLMAGAHRVRVADMAVVVGIRLRRGDAHVVPVAIVIG